MKAEIISTGKELLVDDILNANFKYLSIKLRELGVNEYCHEIVGDDKDILIQILNQSLLRSDLIIINAIPNSTGYDFIKELILRTISKKNTLNNNCLHSVEGNIAQGFTPVTKNDINQSYTSYGITIIPNDKGSVPGIRVKDYNFEIILLPCHYSELCHMFDKHVYESLKLRFSYLLKSNINKTVDIEKSYVRYEDENSKNLTNSSIINCSINGQGDIKVTEKSDTAIDNLNKKFNEYIYSFGGNSLEEEVFNLLISNKLRVGFCESCTGGLVSSRLSKIPGASQVFDRSIITYSNEAKIEELGVKKETIKTYGAVSSETAIEMAQGLHSREGIDIAVSITGIAGPTGDTETKPIGLVYIGLAFKEGTFVEKFNFFGNREEIQWKSASAALDLLRVHILNLNCN